MGADELVVWPVRTIVEVDYPCIRLGSKMSMKLTAVGQGIGFVVDAKMLCIALFGGFIELGGQYRSMSYVGTQDQKRGKMTYATASFNPATRVGILTDTPPVIYSSNETNI